MERSSAGLWVFFATLVASASCEDVVTPKDGVNDDLTPVPSTGGVSSSGGTPSTGGRSASGGLPATGGFQTGGTLGAGGSPIGSGGFSSVGGVMATGGFAATGGAASTGGTPAGFCLADSQGCLEDVYCCSGRCDGTCVACEAAFKSCKELPCCNHLPCTPDEIGDDAHCCRPIESACEASAECCSGSCVRGSCCVRGGAPCTSEEDCCLGTCHRPDPERPGICCTPTRDFCFSSSECCSGSCINNACQ